MYGTIPVKITPAKLISSTATDVHAPAAYNAGTTYALGDIRSVAADFAIYESLASSNLANTPKSSPLWWRKIGPTETAYSGGTIYGLGDTASGNQYVYESRAASNTNNPLPVRPETETTWWIEVQPTNKWAAFDQDNNTQTVCASPLTMVFAPGERVRTAGVMGMEADTLVISATSVFGGGTVYGPYTIDLNTREVLDGYDYCFAPFSRRPSEVRFDVPLYTDIVLTVTLSAASGNVKCGSIVVGQSVYLGKAVHKWKSTEKNYSSTERDIYGKVSLVPRRAVPVISGPVTCPAVAVNKVRAFKEKANAVVLLWTTLDDSEHALFDTFAKLGFYKTLDIGSEQGTNVTIDFVIEEV